MILVPDRPTHCSTGSGIMLWWHWQDDRLNSLLPRRTLPPFSRRKVGVERWECFARKEAVIVYDREHSRVWSA